MRIEVFIIKDSQAKRGEVVFSNEDACRKYRKHVKKIGDGQIDRISFPVSKAGKIITELMNGYSDEITYERKRVVGPRKFVLDPVTNKQIRSDEE